MKKKILFISTIIIFRLLIDWIYNFEIAPFFSYSNYLNNSTRESTFLSWIILAAFIPFVMWIVSDSNRYNSFSQLIAALLLYLRIIPFTSLVMYMPKSSGFVFSNLVYWILIFVLLSYLKMQNPLGLLRSRGGSKSAIFVLTVISVLTVLIVSGVYCGFRIHLSLEDVYELRMEAREFDMPVVLKYLHSATSNIIPILIIYYISKGNRLMVYLLALIGLLNFSIAGHKSTLFKIILCLGLYLFPKLDIKKYLPYFFITLGVITILEFLNFNTIALSTIFIRRGLYVPASLDISYFDFIEKHGPTYFTKGIASEIGSLAGDDAKRCNNGMFSDAFMNLGFLGCIIFPIIFVYFVKISEYITNNLNLSLRFFAAFLIVSTLGSSYFTTSMLTHGLFLLLVTLYLIPKREPKNVRKVIKSCYRG